MLRKVIQIAVYQGRDESNPQIYALCDDGSIWVKDMNYRSWDVVLEIPQVDTGEYDAV